MHRLTSIILIALVWLLGAPVLSGQKSETCCPHYAIETEKTLEGTVESFETPRAPGGRHTIAILESADGVRYELRLGPWDFVKTTGLSLEAGDEVSVVAAPLEPEWKPSASGVVQAVVRNLSKDGTQYRLRDDEGRPLWSRSAGGRR